MPVHLKVLLCDKSIDFLEQTCLSCFLQQFRFMSPDLWWHVADNGALCAVDASCYIIVKFCQPVFMSISVDVFVDRRASPSRSCSPAGICFLHPNSTGRYNFLSLYFLCNNILLDDSFICVSKCIFLKVLVLFVFLQHL